MANGFDEIIEMIIKASTKSDCAEIMQEIENSRQWVAVTKRQINQLQALTQKVEP